MTRREFVLGVLAALLPLPEKQQAQPAIRVRAKVIPNLQGNTLKPATAVRLVELLKKGRIVLPAASHPCQWTVPIRSI